MPADDLPEKPWKRFVVGFGLAASIVLAFFLYGVVYGGDSFSQGFFVACSAAVIAGLFVGVFSAFGKKMLHFFITLFAELFT